MDRAVLELHLAQALQHIEQSEKHIAEQESLIADLDRDGHNTTKAKAFLATLREMHAVHVEGHDRLLRELQKPQTA